MNRPLAALVAVAVAFPAHASPCQTGACQTPMVQAQAVVAPLVLPAYGASYVGYPAGGDDETKELLRLLLKKLDELNENVKTLQPAGGGDGPVPPLAAKRGPDVFDVLKANCVSCHSGDKPRGEFSLMNGEGKFLRLSPADRREVVRRVNLTAGEVMPPVGRGADGKDRKALTPAEKAAIKAALSDTPAIPAGKK